MHITVDIYIFYTNKIIITFIIPIFKNNKKKIRNEVIALFTIS